MRPTNYTREADCRRLGAGPHVARCVRNCRAGAASWNTVVGGAIICVRRRRSVTRGVCILVASTVVPRAVFARRRAARPLAGSQTRDRTTLLVKRQRMA